MVLGCVLHFVLIKIYWCNSKFVKRLLLGWNEVIFLFLMTFFQIYLKLFCSKRKEPPLNWGSDILEEMMRPFWQSRFTSLSKSQKVWCFYHFSLQRKSEIVQRPWASLRACLRPFLTSLGSTRLRTSFCANKIYWCNSKFVKRLLLGWNEVIFLFLMMFFFKFI